MKNKMMRIASLVLILTLLSTCAISGTFAKYVTQNHGSDTARVAKWGVSVAVNGTTFAKEYAKDDDSFTLHANSVVSTDKVMAPGTSGSMAGVTLGGTPEVAARVTYTADFDFSDNWTVDNAVYCPIIVTINGQKHSMTGANKTTIADFETYLEGIVAAYSKDYAAGTDLSTKGSENLTIAWEWPFYVDAATDAKDTWLGSQAVNSNAATLSVTLTATVTQID